MSFCRFVFSVFSIRRLRCCLGGGALAILTLIGFSCDARPEQAAAELQSEREAEPPVFVRLGEFLRSDVSDRLEVYADLEAVEKADVYPEIAGVIKQVLKREGDPVKKGEPVIRLEDEALQLKVDTEKVRLEQARSKVTQAELAKREGAESTRQKKLAMEQSESEFERIRKLVEEGRGVISPEEADSKRYALEKTRSDHRSALLQEERYKLEYQSAILDEKLAAVELKTAEYNLAQTILDSPIDGVISHLRLKRGELVSTSTHVFTSIDVSLLEGRLQVPQRELRRLKEGQAVEIKCQVFPDESFAGKIEVIKPVVDRSKGTVEVLVAVRDDTHFLKPGMFVSGSVILNTRSNAWLVPKKAITYTNQEKSIFLARDGKSFQYTIRSGYSTRDAVEVLGVRPAGANASRAGDGRADKEAAKPDADDETMRGNTDGWMPVRPELGQLILVGHDNLKDGARIETE